MPDLINTGGGASIGGSVSTGGGNVIGRDQIIVVSVAGLDDKQLETALCSLEKVLADRRVELRTDSAQLTVSAPDAPPVTLSEAAAKALLGETGRRGDLPAYLSALVVNPRYGRWGSQFVPLAGMLTEQTKPLGWNEIPPEFTELEMRGEGPQRQIRRVKLDDITEAVARHAALVLLGEPGSGSGKTTTLERLLLDGARDALRSESERVPLLLPLADYRDYPSPRHFLDARWRQQVGANDLENRLRNGRLLLLCDALNEMPFQDQRDYRRRVGAWREFIRALPAGNRVVFTCRSLDYSEPLGLPQVEIDRLDDPRVEDFLHRYLDSTDPASAKTVSWNWSRPSP